MVLEVSGGLSVGAPRAAVWAALHDPACLERCVPGCSGLARVSPTRFDLTVRVALGPVSVPFEGHIEVVASEPVAALTLRGAGHGIAGLADGSVWIALVDSPRGCHLAYTLRAETRGPLAGLGLGLLAGLAKGLVDSFGASFAAALAAPVRVATAVACGAAEGI